MGAAGVVIASSGVGSAPLLRGAAVSPGAASVRIDVGLAVGGIAREVGPIGCRNPPHHQLIPPGTQVASSCDMALEVRERSGGWSEIGGVAGDAANAHFLQIAV